VEIQADEADIKGYLKEHTDGVDIQVALKNMIVEEIMAQGQRWYSAE
jgi:hypothetical protein